MGTGLILDDDEIEMECNSCQKDCIECDRKEELFIGIEETNIEKFISPCCEGWLSIEPLSRLCCGICGKQVKEKEAIYLYY